MCNSSVILKIKKHFPIPCNFQYGSGKDTVIVVIVFQGPQGVPVTYSPTDPLHDQLESVTSTVCHPADCVMVRNSLDRRCLSESKQTSRSHQCGLHHWWASVQHVSAGPLGLHDSCGWVNLLPKSFLYEYLAF